MALPTATGSLQRKVNETGFKTPHEGFFGNGQTVALAS
jgi:hypothetical protein